MASAAVLGASGYAGAIAASLLWRHPFFELKHVTARSEAGAVLDEVHPRTRVPLLLEDWDPDVQGDVDAALVCWPHRVSAPAVAALRERGVRVVRSAGGALLGRAEVFDVYRGAQVGEGATSLALRLEFRAPDRTLTDEEAAERREKIVAALGEQLGARLRG